MPGTGIRKTKFLRLAIAATLLCWLALRLVPAPVLLDARAGSRAMYDSDGGLLTLSLSNDDKYRLYTPYREISSELIRSALLYEDRNFFRHPGVNPYALVRGAFASLLHPNRPVGGSTITMQLARIRLGLETRSLTGKLRQIFWALVLERHYSKEQILEAYLNLAPYGANVEGVGAAGLVYFGKPARKINLAEAVTLTVLPQHPASRWKASGREELEIARNELARRWRNSGKAQEIIPADFRYSPASVPSRAPHLYARLHELKPDSVELQSTLDASLQREAEDVLQTSLARFAEFGVHNGTMILAELPDLNVRAYVGSANYLSKDIDGFVNGLAGERSPGSLLKPFIYGLAIDQGKLTPDTMLSDVPIRLAAYAPENFEKNFLGPIPAGDALVRSRNIPALEVFRMLEPGSFYRMLGGAGVQRLREEDHYCIALVLGGLGVTSEEAAELYGILGNNGERRPLQFFKSEKSVPAQTMLSQEASFLVKDMLSKNPPALGRFKDKHIPWKTGTSYGSRDAWAAGIVGRYVLVTWLGNFDGRSNPNLVGRDFAGPVFFSMVDRLLSQGVLPYPPPPSALNLKKIEVCALSGAPAGPHCPHKKQGWFIPGVSPIRTCAIHQEIRVNPENGLRVCKGDSGGAPHVYEVWDSRMQDLFTRAGLRRNVPPPFEARCGISGPATSDVRIISPEDHVEYFLEAHRDLDLQFLASVPGDSRALSWFVDDTLVGQVNAGEAFHWKARAGHFDIRAVDDLGRSAVVRLGVSQQAQSSVVD